MTNLQNVKNIMGEENWNRYDEYMKANGKDASQRIAEIISEDIDFDAEYVAKTIINLMDKNDSGELEAADQRRAAEYGEC